MDMGNLALAIKLISQEYRLSDREVTVFKNRMLSDSSEFERVWSTYKNRTKVTIKGVDSFKELLKELLS
jgi:hypothetical protein